MKTTKLLSIILVIILAVVSFGFQVSAENTATVSLYGEPQAIVDSEYEVTLKVTESYVDQIGGIQAEIKYDSAKFELDRAEISDSVVNSNYSVNNNDLVSDNQKGTVKLMLLDVPKDGTSYDLLTLVFIVKSDAELGVSEFKIDNANASDAAGTNFIIKNHSMIIEDNIYAHMIDVNGASIRKDGVGNIRFEAAIDSTIDKSKIAAVGVMILPTVYIDNGDLKAYIGDLSNKDDPVKYTMSNGKNKIIARVYVPIDEIGDSDKFYAYLTNTTSFKLYTSFSARAYVVLDDNTVIYSDNKIVENNIVGGTSSKSCIDTAKAIYEKFNTSYDLSSISSIIAKDATDWTPDDYTTVVKALAKVNYNS